MVTGVWQEMAAARVGEGYKTISKSGMNSLREDQVRVTEDQEKREDLRILPLME